MKIPHTDLSVKDTLYVCPVEGCEQSYWNTLGYLTAHIKKHHPEHFKGYTS